MPEIWKPWFAPHAVPAGHDFLRQIYATLAHTNKLDQ
jgi:hypothetical protein